MEAVGAKRIERRDVEVLQNIEHHQCGEPLRVRRNLDEVQSTIVCRNRLNLVATMAEEILRGKKRLSCLQRPGHVVGDFAFVEGARAFARDRLQGGGKRRKANDIALAASATIEKIVRGGARI